MGAPIALKTIDVGAIHDIDALCVELNIVLQAEMDYAVRHYCKASVRLTLVIASWVIIMAHDVIRARIENDQCY